jgi:hypothetical protein
MWWEVRIAWARRKDYIPTAMQVERGLIDRDELVRKTWAMRMDFEPTSAQVERGLADVLVGKEWIERVRLCTEKSMQDDDYTISI